MRADRGDGPRRRARPRARSIIAAGLCAVILLLTWPARWGGFFTFVIVSGDSMEPTLRSGDIALVRPRSAYAVGEVVAYRLPATASPSRPNVIHRVIAIEDDHSLRLQGDNRAVPDGFLVPRDDVVGSMRLRLPRAGLALWVLSRWWMLAAVAAAITTIVLWPGNDVPTRAHASEDG